MRGRGATQRGTWVPLMKARYLRFYESYSARAPLRFFWDGLREGSQLRKLSLRNRQRDYLDLAQNPPLLALHRQLNQVLLESEDAWDAYDYGEGYFYQSLDEIHVTGLRDTRTRVAAMGLRELVEGRPTLEIGCNTAFVSLSIADVVPRLVGFDLNPHLVRIGELAARFLERPNVELRVSSFEDLETDASFGAVLSFANHKTYDGNTRISTEAYFDKCHALLEPGGLLLFESHPPELEGDGLEGVCEIIAERFHVMNRCILREGTFLDRNRTFLVARKEGR